MKTEINEVNQNYLRRKSIMKKAFITFVTVLLVFSFTLTVFAYSTAPNSNVLITKTNQTVDSLDGVDALYRPVSVKADQRNTTYSCAAYATKYFAKLYGVTLNNLLPNQIPRVTKGILTVVTTPRKGDLAFWAATSQIHSAIVKSISGSTVTLIEQNWKSSSSGKWYAKVNRTITTTNSGVKFYRWSSQTVQLPDLIPTSILYNSNELAVGRQIFLNSGIRNAGSVASSSFHIKWFVNNVQSGYGSHAAVPANTTVLNGNSGYYWTPASSGTYVIKFVIDVDRHIAESNENNNEISITVYVPPSGGSVSRPGIPTNLRQTNVTGNTVNLAWNSVSGAQNYQIFESTNNRDWWSVGHSDNPYYKVNGLSPNMTYYFKVRSHNSAGDSDFCSSISVRTNSNYS